MFSLPRHLPSVCSLSPWHHPKGVLFNNPRNFVLFFLFCGSGHGTQGLCAWAKEVPLDCHSLISSCYRTVRVHSSVHIVPFPGFMWICPPPITSQHATLLSACRRRWDHHLRTPAIPLNSDEPPASRHPFSFPI